MVHQVYALNRSHVSYLWKILVAVEVALCMDHGGYTVHPYRYNNLMPSLYEVTSLTKNASALQRKIKMAANS